MPARRQGEYQPHHRMRAKILASIRPVEGQPVGAENFTGSGLIPSNIPR